MPTQESFSPEGVANKMEELYALTDPQLFAEADEAKADFPAWIVANFVLDQDQQTYLGGIALEWIDDAANRFHNALVNRRPVLFDKPIYIDPNSFSSKIIRTEDEAIVVYNQLTGVETTGTLTFVISVDI